MSEAKYCMSVDMADMRINGTAEVVEVGKKKIYPLVRDAQACKKDVSNEYQHENPKHSARDEMTCKTEVKKTLRTKF